jgi:ABC-2 type transport system permease protein
MLAQIWVLTRNEVRLWAQRPSSWAVTFIVPFLFIWIIGAVFGSSGTPTVALFVANEDSGTRGQEAISALKAAETLDVKVLADHSDADRRVGRGERMAAVVIPADFSDSLLSPEGATIAIILDPARTEQAGIVTGLVNGALSPLIVDAEVTRGVELGVMEAVTDLDLESDDRPLLKSFLTAAFKGVIASQVQAATNDPLVQVKLQPAADEGAEIVRPPTLMEGLAPGYSLMFAFYLVSNLASAVLAERRVGTLRRLLATPVSRGTVLLGKMLPYLLLAIVQLTVVLSVSSVLFGIGLGSSPLALALVIAATALVVATLGIMIAALAKTAGQAGGLTILLVTSMAVISGSMYPAISVPGAKYLAPHYWAIQGFQNVLSRGLGLEAVLLPVGILGGMSLVFFLIGTWRFRFS